ncbi:MAG TPA: TIGR03915 family putative DNA repair protein [Longimicrobium sp.]|nr:TIGR03915 family putative DNA repair protein [Longimicrobium sp.]
MRTVVFEPTFDGWRAAARRLLEEGAAPDSLAWRPAGSEGGLLDALGDPVEVAAARSRPSERFRVPRRFLALAEAAACHGSGERWALLYRILWRMAHGEPALMEVAVDPDVHRLLRMEKAVRREVHKMHAFVRFRAVEHEGGAHYVAWFEPEHPVVERAAPFFAERFASMRWSILTPGVCAHWDGEALAFTPGVPRSAAPTEDALEGLWRTYYASTFNPARLRTTAMRAEMPVRYWRNLPEAGLIAPLVSDAPARVRRMIEEQTRPKTKAPRRVYRSPAEKARAEREGDEG